jgi:hypothetical protein
MSYYQDKRDERAALVLSRYSPDVVEDIMRLCQRKGGSLLGTIYTQDGAGGNTTLRPYAILSDAYVDEDSFSSILLALDMIVIAEIRKPNFSNDRYQAILQNAFGLPRQLAEPIAKRIETFDVLGGANPEGRALMTKVADRLKETARRVANYAAGLLQLPWEIDQNQKYDIDFLYEMKLLGDAAKEFNVRAKLMTSQAAINSNLGLLQAGDLYGDPEDSMAGEIGDIMGRASLRNLPMSMFGSMFPTMQLGASATQAQASEVLNQAGVTAENGKVAQVAPKNPMIAKIFKGIATANPAVALLAGLTTGAGGMLLKNAIANARNKNQGATGDIDSEVYGEIGDIMGDDVAQAWMSGDIDTVAEAFGDLLSDDDTTGDPELDSHIEDEIRHQYGDIDNARFGPEIGGLFTRFRTNMAKRRGAGRRRRSIKKTARQRRKNTEAQAFANARASMSNDLDDPNMSFQQGFDDPPPMQQMDADYEPGDYEQSDAGQLPDFYPM